MSLRRNRNKDSLVLAIVFVVATTANMLEDIREEYYELFSSNCDLKNAIVGNISSSIERCAVLCIHTSTCTGIGRRNGYCGVLENYQACCAPSTGDDDDGWKVYFPKSKIYLSPIFTIKVFWFILTSTLITCKRSKKTLIKVHRRTWTDFILIFLKL